MIKVNFAFQWKTLFFEETWKRPCIVFVFLSGETKQLSLLGNYWALLSINGNLIHALKAQCFGTKMAPYFNDLKDEESFERRTRKLSARFLASLNNNQKKRHCSKVNLSWIGRDERKYLHNTANNDCLSLKSAVNHKQ